MNTTMLILSLVMYVVIIFLVILNIRMLKMIGKYIQYIEFLSEKNNSIKQKGVIEEVPYMKLTSVVDNKFELTIDDQLDKDLLLVFLSPSCEACKEMYSNIKNNINKDKVTTMIISNDLSLDNNREYLDYFNQENINFAVDIEAFQQLRIERVPYMMYVDKNRKILEQGNPGNGNKIHKVLEKYGAII
ncbi:hypothetical protein ACFVR1_08520 [Psychrobacillus sp. NPDC058041]|uniref:hypothetical protein n=1 Tax=Psychrobacillus sp. NPDC058041 TaxID=3346310 RepID=UPI0036DAD3D7